MEPCKCHGCRMTRWWKREKQMRDARSYGRLLSRRFMEGRR